MKKATKRTPKATVPTKKAMQKTKQTPKVMVAKKAKTQTPKATAAMKIQRSPMKAKTSDPVVRHHLDDLLERVQSLSGMLSSVVRRCRRLERTSEYRDEHLAPVGCQLQAANDLVFAVIPRVQCEAACW